MVRRFLGHKCYKKKKEKEKKKNWIPGVTDNKSTTKMLQQADTQQKVLCSHTIHTRQRQRRRYLINSYIMHDPSLSSFPLLTDSLTNWLKMERWGFSWNPGSKVMSLNVRERKKVRRGRSQEEEEDPEEKFIVLGFRRAVDHMSLEHIRNKGWVLVTLWPLPCLHYKGMYLERQKMSYGNSNISPCKNTTFKKNPLKETKIASRYHTSYN